MSFRTRWRWSSERSLSGAYSGPTRFLQTQASDSRALSIYVRPQNFIPSPSAQLWQDLKGPQAFKPWDLVRQMLGSSLLAVCVVLPKVSRKPSNSHVRLAHPGLGRRPCPSNDQALSNKPCETLCASFNILRDQRKHIDLVCS